MLFTTPFWTPRTCARTTGIAWCLVGGTAMFSVAPLFAADPPPESPPVSQYASTAALRGQVDYYTERMAKSLKDEAKYSDASKTRVAKDASTVGLLLLALGLHDDDSSVRSSAPRLVELAEKVVTVSDDYVKAAAALDALQKGIADGAEGGRTLKWEPRFNLEMLMKQTTTVNNRLKRNTKKEKTLAKRRDDAMGQAAFLAVVGQVTVLETDFVEDKSQLDEWYRLSQVMRDTAGAVERSISDGNFSAVQENVKLLQKNCDECHEVFRIETD